ncbi:MAG: cohesin domain-containing protein [Rhodothermales bacterium]|nr:cohesin domain-containing protein [Rhodothermales bacterium]
MWRTLYTAVTLLVVALPLQPAQAQISVSLPAVTAQQGTSQDISLTVGNLTNQNVTSYQFSITYNPTVLEIDAVSVAGTLSAGTSATINTATSGVITVAWASANALTGQGALIKLSADFIGVGSSALTISDFIFNEGVPAASATNGSVTVSSTPPPPSIAVSLPSNASTQVGAGAVAVPVTVGPVTGSNITSYALTVMFNPAFVNITGATVGGTLSSTANASVTTGSGTITVSWSGAALSGSGTLVNLTASPVAAGTSNLSFTSMTFNGGTPTATTTNGSITVTPQTGVGSVSMAMPASFSGTIGTTVDIPITVDNLTGKGVNSYQLVIGFDPAIVNVTSATVAGTLSSGGEVVPTSLGPGSMSIIWAGANALSGSGVLLNLKANLRTVGASPLTFTSTLINEGSPTATTTNGQLVVSANTGVTPIAVALSARSGNVGETLTIPVSVGDLTGRGVSSFEFTMTYNPALVSMGVSQTGTLSAATAAIVNTDTPGEVTVAWASVANIAGAGALVNLQLSLLAEGTSPITFDSFSFNEGSPAATLTNGSVTVSSNATIINIALPQNSTGNIGETLTIPIQVGNTSNSNVTSYAFTMAFSNALLSFAGVDVAGTLSAASVPTVNTATPGQVTVSWQGSALTGSGVLANVRFNLLSDGTTPLTFSSFSFNSGTPQSSLQNGNITISGSGALGVSAPSGLIGSVGEQLQIPIAIGVLTGRNVTSFSFTLTYDASDLTINDVNTEGTLLAGQTLDVTQGTGQITVAFTGSQPLTGSGTLIKLVADLVTPGTSALVFTAFTLNTGTPAAAAIDGSITVQGVTASIQLIHNSPDAPIVDVYVNDVKVADALSYARATAFIEFTTAVLTIDVVNDQAASNTQPIATTNVTLINGQAYVAVLNGLFAGSGKQALGIVVEETVLEASGDDTVDLLAFQGSPDAPLLEINLVDDSGAHRTVAAFGTDIAFGEGRLASGIEPGLYHMELVDSNGTIVNTYRADLTRTAGSALLFMIQGFVDPIITQPDLTITAYAPDGRAIFLPLSTANEDGTVVPVAFSLDGNYPNPFNPSTTIQFGLPEPAEVAIDVFDLLGRHVLSVPSRPFTAGDAQIAPLDASELASGTYVYRVTARGAQQTYTSSDTMTLLK